MLANENRSYNVDSSNSSISNFQWPNFDNFITHILLSVPKHFIKPFIISMKNFHFFPSIRTFFCVIIVKV
jgi:hypothetical protein